eukprot:TRINITY_DN6638_c0_g1_i2.p1 TRINITY_DN6638_c0_g1~~TRINITY_DN6638_c0_g1_i2.p1  ORF type:complete len:452 (-),score=79.04 TRINITY_DN6638_c0_g1_i2:33-1388(-)
MCIRDRVSTQSTWVVRFGRVDITQNEALRSKVPFKIRSFPAILSYAPTGDFDLLSSTAAFNPTEVKRALQDLLGKAVEQISYNSATKFLETSTSYYYSRFNVLLLPKKKDIPLDYMWVAMDNFGMMNFGAVPSTERVQTLEILKVNSKHNLLYAYKPDDKKTKIESFDVNLKDMKSIISLLMRHSIVEIYKNNFQSYCHAKMEFNQTIEIGEDDEEVSETRRLVCVMALLDVVPAENDKIKNFQKYVLGHFQKASEEYKKKQLLPLNVQYAAIKLSWHPELADYVRKNHKLDSQKLSYIIMSADNEAYSLVSPSNSLELDKAITQFLGDDSSLEKYYLRNQNTTLMEMISRDDDTLIKALINIGRSSAMILSLFAVAIGAYIIKKYTKWDYANTFVSLMIISYTILALISLLPKWHHFFGQSQSLSHNKVCLLYTSPSPRDLSTSRMPSSA